MTAKNERYLAIRPYYLDQPSFQRCSSTNCLFIIWQLGLVGCETKDPPSMAHSASQYQVM